MPRAIVVGFTFILAAAGIAAAYLEFGLDIRVARSQAWEAGVVSPVNKLSTERYIERTKEMKERYGPNAQTYIGPNAMTTKVNDELVGRENVRPSLLHVFGLTVIGARQNSDAVSIFPFQLAPDRDPTSPAMHFLAATIQAQYKRLFKNKYLDFSDADYAIEPCWSFGPEEVDLPIARQLLGLRRSAMCIVTWQREPRARMLVGFANTEGSLWLRTFARGACHVLAEAWLAKSADSIPPDYVQCVLGDRPHSPNGVSTVVYERLQDGQLALIE